MSLESPPRLRPKTLSAQVQESIREAILSRRLPSGQRIDQTKLAADLNVSLVPVREALKSLEAEGLVCIIPRRGAFVTEVSLEGLEELYQTRQIIEGEAVYHAVALLKPADIEALYALETAMRQATDAEDLQTFMNLNRQFHMTIYDALGNQTLQQIISGLWEKSELYRYRYMFVARSCDAVHEEHLALVQACESGDAARAKQIAVEHIQHTCRGLRQELEQVLRSA